MYSYQTAISQHEMRDCTVYGYVIHCIGTGLARD